MSRSPWNYIKNYEWPDCTVVTYTDEKGLTTRTYISDLILVSDGKQAATGHCVNGIFYSMIPNENIVRWRNLPGWMKEKIKTEKKLREQTDINRDILGQKKRGVSKI